MLVAVVVISVALISLGMGQGSSGSTVGGFNSGQMLVGFPYQGFPVIACAQVSNASALITSCLDSSCDKPRSSAGFYNRFVALVGSSASFSISQDSAATLGYAVYSAGLTAEHDSDTLEICGLQSSSSSSMPSKYLGKQPRTVMFGRGLSALQNGGFSTAIKTSYWNGGYVSYFNDKVVPTSVCAQTVGPRTITANMVACIEGDDASQQVCSAPVPVKIGNRAQLLPFPTTLTAPPFQYFVTYSFNFTSIESGDGKSVAAYLVMHQTDIISQFCQ